MLDLWDGTVPVDVFSLIEALGVELHYGELGGGRLAEARVDSLTLNDRLPAKKSRVVAALALVRYLNGEYLFEVDGTESKSVVQAAREILVPEFTVGLSSFEVSDCRRTFMRYRSGGLPKGSVGFLKSIDTC